VICLRPAAGEPPAGTSAGDLRAESPFPRGHDYAWVGCMSRAVGLPFASPRSREGRRRVAAGSIGFPYTSRTRHGAGPAGVCTGVPDPVEQSIALFSLHRTAPRQRTRPSSRATKIRSAWSSARPFLTTGAGSFSYHVWEPSCNFMAATKCSAGLLAELAPAASSASGPTIRLLYHRPETLHSSGIGAGAGLRGGPRRLLRAAGTAEQA